MSNKVKNQHYVPQFYLRNFSSDGRSIAVYRFKDNQIAANASIKGMCSEKYFYDNDNSVENAFSAKEERWSAIIKKIVLATDSINFNDDEQKSIRELFYYQNLRTRGSVNHGQSIIKTVLKSVADTDSELKNANSEILDSIIQKHSEELVTPAWLVQENQETLKAIAEMQDLSIAVLHNQTSKRLITSDSPVFMINPFCEHTVGLFVVGIVMILPISPQKALMLYDSGVYNNVSDNVVITSEDDVSSINNSTLRNAEEIVLAYNAADFSDLKNINTERKKHIDENSFNTARADEVDEVDEVAGRADIIHLKSRAIRTSSDISFLRVPDKIQTIPETCREAFPRKYDVNSRVSLLLRIYFLPDKIAEKIKAVSNAAVKGEDIEKGWKILLEFMDDYWHLSEADKNYSQRAFDDVKGHVKLSYFAVPQACDKCDGGGKS